MLLVGLSCLTLTRTFLFFKDTATTEIYTLSLHDALPICGNGHLPAHDHALTRDPRPHAGRAHGQHGANVRSEEHTSELQSQSNLVCRLLLEKKNRRQTIGVF